MIRQVLLAPVPWEHLESAEVQPELRERVAFGSSSAQVHSLSAGIPVFIYGSDHRHKRFRPGIVTWAGTLGAVVKAVQSGPRSGKHPERSVRPPSAEEGDTAFENFFEVLGLQPLAAPRKLAEFTKSNGKGKPFTGDVPRWPVLAYLDCWSSVQGESRGLWVVDHFSGDGPRRRFPSKSRLRDSLAFGRSEAYPAHSGTLTAGLLASFPRRSFTAAS
jgi:hypothetical protein